MSTKLKLIIAFVFVIAVIVPLGFLVSGVNNTLNYKGIYDGIYVDDINLSGKNLESAKDELFNRYQQKLNDMSIPIVYGSKQWKLKFSDVDMMYNYENVASKAYKLGRKGNFLNRLKEITDLKRHSIHLKMKITRKDTRVNSLTDKIADYLYISPEEPSLKRENNSFYVTAGRDGISVDKDKLKKDILSRLDNISDDKVYVSCVTVKPKHSEAELAKVSDVLGEFKTGMHGSSGRVHNLALAATRMNGKLLYTGDIFSLNKALGPRTVANGFQKAPVIVDNKVVDGDGGGVCQVATTLYGAVIRSKISVEERAHHSIPSSYCPIGQDATIAGDYLDFKFKNNSKYPIYVSSWTDSNYLYARIYGYKENLDEEVSIISELLDTYPVPQAQYIYDKSLKKGTSIVERNGQRGYYAKVYRIIKVNGVETSRQLLSTNKYQPVAPLYRIGTGK